VAVEEAQSPTDGSKSEQANSKLQKSPDEPKSPAKKSGDMFGSTTKL